MGWKGKEKMNPALIYERLVDHSDDVRTPPATPKGYVPVLVGSGATMERILVSVKLFNDPCISLLLEKAEEELGGRREGVLRITCDVEHFRRVVGSISKGVVTRR